MSDLVGRLRAPIRGNIHDERKEAADEIERLRAALELLEKRHGQVGNIARAALKGVDENEK